MPGRRLACAFVDDVENAAAQSLHFIDGAPDRVLLAATGAVTELCIWVSVEALVREPFSRVALSLWAHGLEVDWITYEYAAVAAPAGWPEVSYTVDHIFSIPHHLTYRECIFEVRAASERGPIATAQLALEFPPPF